MVHIWTTIRAAWGNKGRFFTVFYVSNSKQSLSLTALCSSYLGRNKRPVTERRDTLVLSWIEGELKRKIWGFVFRDSVKHARTS